MTAPDRHTARFTAPTSLDRLLQILAQDPTASCLAGGASIFPSVNAGSPRPPHLVSLRQVPELASRIHRHDAQTIEIAAMTRHAEIAAATAEFPELALLAETAGQIAHPTIRNMGTIGGSVANAEFNADYPSALVAADAVVCTRSVAGTRRIAADAFFLGHMKTALQPGEIVTAIRLPCPAARESAVYLKFSRVDGDYAIAAIALRLALTPDGRCATLALAIGGCAPAPVRLPATEAAALGQAPDTTMIDRIAADYAAAVTPADDIKASAGYRRRILPGLIRRAFDTALQRHKETLQ